MAKEIESDISFMVKIQIELLEAWHVNCGDTSSLQLLDLPVAKLLQ